MDFLDPKKKRAHTIRLFVGYALVAVALLIGTGIIALEAYGFDFDRKTGVVIQNGLVFVDAHPDTADIYINGVNKGRTDNRLVMPAAQYSIELKRSGYRSWKNNFQLDGGSIERFVYPFLFPEKLVTKELKQYATSPGMVSESPDHHWLVVQQPPSMSIFDIYDLTTTANEIAVINIPESLLTATKGPQSIELAEWSTDNRHFLVKHSYDGVSEYILIDRETPTTSQNLNKFFARPGTQFSLRDKKYDQYYAYDPVVLSLSTADLKTKQVVLAIDKVVSFKPHGSDVVLYVTTGVDGKQFVRVKSGTDTYTLRELAKSDTYLLDLARFDNKWYMVAGSPSEGKTYIYRDPIDKIKAAGGTKLPAPTAVLRLDAPQFLSFSANARFIAVQSAGMFSLYDAETGHSLRYDTKLPISTYKATWMDGHRLMASQDGKLVVFDFDGTNLQTLSALDATHVPAFDKDYKAMFSIAPSATAGKTSVQRTELKVPN